MSRLMPTEDEMRARFAELKVQEQELDQQMEPLREEQARIAALEREHEIEVNKQLKELNARRAELTDEMGLINRALGGRTMSDGAVDSIEVQLEDAEVEEETK